MDALRRSFSTVKRCRKAVWTSMKNNFLLSCIRRRRPSSVTRRTTENALVGATAAVAENSTINENISVTTTDVGSEEQQLPEATNSSKTEEGKESSNGVTQEEGLPRNIVDEAGKKKTRRKRSRRRKNNAEKPDRIRQRFNEIVEDDQTKPSPSVAVEATATAKTVPNVSPGDEQADENVTAGRSEKAEFDGDADDRCRTVSGRLQKEEEAPATPASSIPMEVRRPEIRTSGESLNEGAGQRSQTDKCSAIAEAVDNEEAKGDFNRTTRSPEPKAALFPPETIQPDGRNRQLSVGSGLINTGVICYINSTLQALFHIPAFSNWLMNNEAHQNDCRQEVICEDLSTDRQEDAHEFLCYLIGGMERDCLAVSGRADEPAADVCSITSVSQIFGGHFRTEVTCGGCANRSITFQYFQELILDIKRSDNVSGALRDYFEGERLSYACDACRREVVAEKKCWLEQAPTVLCVQLKRYDVVGLTCGLYGKKINKAMAIDERLELSGHVRGTDARPLRYRLVSMVLHYGASLDSGHYTAVCLAPSGSRYYCFDDDDVYPTGFDAYAKCKHSYVMFYELDSSDSSEARR